MDTLATTEIPPAPLLTGSSPEPHRLLGVLDSLGCLGFASISDFLTCLFGSDDRAVRQRVDPFYAQGGIKSLMEIFMKSSRARANGGDEVAVSWSCVVFKNEFDIGLVKGRVRYLHPHRAPLRVLTAKELQVNDVRASPSESPARRPW